MNAHHNIQFLFSAISVAAIQQYLFERGWRTREAPGTDRLYFERTGNVGEEGSTVWSWATNEHPKFRSQVPNIVFTLSILESRPALEIANDIFAARNEKPSPKAEAAALPKPPASTTVSNEATSETMRRCVLRLSRATALMIPLDVLDEKVDIAAGDVVEIVYFGATNSELDLEIGDGVIQVRIPQSAGVRLLQGVAKPCLGERWSAMRIVREELTQLEDVGESKAAAELLDALGPTLARIDFELEPAGESGASMQNAIRRQAAVLASGLARRLDDTPRARQVVWRACAKLIYPVGLRLELTNVSVDELFTAAATDEELSPRKTLAWLKEHGVAINGE